METQRNKVYQHLEDLTMEISKEEKNICINSASLGQTDCLPQLLANFVKYLSGVFPCL